MSENIGNGPEGQSTTLKDLVGQKVHVLTWEQIPAEQSKYGKECVRLNLDWGGIATQVVTAAKQIVELLSTKTEPFDATIRKRRAGQGFAYFLNEIGTEPTFQLRAVSPSVLDGKEAVFKEVKDLTDGACLVTIKCGSDVYHLVADAFAKEYVGKKGVIETRISKNGNAYTVFKPE